MRRIARDLGPGPFALVTFFIASADDCAAIARVAEDVFPGAAIMGCTTAGEISPVGYTNDEIVAVGFPALHFAASVQLIENLGSIDRRAIAARLMAARAHLAHDQPDWPYEFAFMMIDGMSLREEEASAAIASGLGPMPLFGGSAGDGLAFKKTFVMKNGMVRDDAATVAIVRSRCQVKTFKLDHLTPSDEKMVVTRADPSRRLVREINAEPAAREYARMLGKDPEQLTPFIFAAHPLLVRIGGEHHVRAIRQVEPNGDLIFFSAIDEGLVLTMARALDIADHLEDSLARLSRRRRPAAIIACDCVLRRIDVEQKQATQRISRILSRHGVIGFNTYGEQTNGAHVNQTMTGVAIYAPENDRARRADGC